jgi:iron complex outermembrane receptor protein
MRALPFKEGLIFVKTYEKGVLMMKMIRKVYVYFILFSFLVTIPYFAYAQQNGNTAPTFLSDEMMLFEEIPSVYSASKYEQKVTEAPSSVSIVTADEIQKYGYRTFAEILQSIRGFQITYDRAYRYLGVRGFGLPADYNNRILVLVDGHSINDNIYDAPALGTAFPVEIDLIDRIEVVRGPSSSLYGSSAFFAIINVITKRGRDYKGFEVSGEAGSFDTYKARLSYGNRFQNGMEILLSGSYYDSEGDDHLFFREFDDPETNNGIAEDLDYDRYHNVFLELTFHDFTLQGGYHDRKKGIPTAPWETIFNDDLFFVDEQYYLDLKYERTYERQLSVLARLSYNYYKFNGDYPIDWADPGDPPDVVINKDRTKGQWLEGELRMTKPLMDKHKVTLGAHYRNNLKQDQLNFDEGIEDGVYLDDKRDLQNWAVFFQDEFALTDSLILNGGIRYDDYETFGSTFNPRIALIYNPFEKTILKAIYGSAFRAPSAFELFYHDGFDTQKPNPDLDPETIDTYELILEQSVGTNLRGTIVGFYYTVDDLITLQTDPADDLLFFNNVDQVEAKGIEFELEGKWQSGLQGRISYAYQKTENDETGKSLINSPKHLAKLNVVVPLLREKIFLGIEEQYTGKRKTIANNETDDFFITNVTLFSKNLLKGLDVSASVYNLFDREYDDPAGEEHEQDTLEQDGLTVRLKLTYLF